MKKRHLPKVLPELRPCQCGDIGITLRPRGGSWSVYCLSQTCNCSVRGFDTELDAILAWNEATLRWAKEVANK